MIREAIDETRRLLQGRPALTAAALMAAALGAGAHAAIFYEADGEEFRLTAAHTTTRVMEDDVSDPFNRMRARLGCMEKIPGFTVIVGLSEYNVELSVPVMGMRSLFDKARPDVAVITSAPAIRRAA
ncbi:hypothetical protein [Edaphobacter flagellatus]|uniref:hypothetical protein n=1 Tax=Edaphobacter flagellatus TaxID=1933044 RepID=UPI0021B2B47E|nr:hypothetical protein [Edaphobacter flagellatus]